MSITSLDSLHKCVKHAYQRNATQFLASVQGGEASIRGMLHDCFANEAIDVDAIQRELTEGIEQLVGTGEEDGGNA